MAVANHDAIMLDMLNTPTVLADASTIILGRLANIHVGLNAHLRMLKATDENFSIGVFPSTWQPDEDSHEMGHYPSSEPTLLKYQIGIHVLTKDSDRIRGLAIHTALTKRVRSVLYRDATLRVGLESLSVTDSFGTESYRKGRPQSIRYLSSEIGNNQLAYLSVLDYNLDTEMR